VSTESTPGATAAPVGVEAELREEAIASLKRKRKFMEDAVAYLTINGVLWLIWALTDRSSDGSVPWPAWVSLIWGGLLAIDAWKAFGRWPATVNRSITDVDIERETRRLRGV
jgi:hypothetical protein